MKVRELIALLSQHDPDMEVFHPQDPHSEQFDPVAGAYVQDLEKTVHPSQYIGYTLAPEEVYSQGSDGKLRKMSLPSTKVKGLVLNG